MLVQRIIIDYVYFTSVMFTNTTEMLPIFIFLSFSIPGVCVFYGVRLARDLVPTT